MRRFGIAPFVILILAGVSAGQQITIDGIDLQEVGDPGNAPDTNGTGYGQVGYAFKMGKYDTTVNQYVAFLNAVGSTDPYNCYDGADMDYLPVSSTGSGSNFGCGIVRSGTFGSYTYALDPNLPAGGFNWGDLPVNFVSWGSAARYCNWLDNGMPTTGQETVGTTEQGSYTLNGATSASLPDGHNAELWRALGYPEHERVVQGRVLQGRRTVRRLLGLPDAEQHRADQQPHKPQSAQLCQFL